ncbi:MAG: response regulator [Pyrinomonadaceae bacterium]
MYDRTTFNLLLLEDNHGDAEMVKESLEDVPGYDFVLTRANNLNQAVERLGKNNVDGILLDLNVDDSRGIETLKRLQSVRTDLAYIVLSGLTDDRLRSQVLREGAQDFIGKNEPRTRLLARSILYSIERHQARELQSNLQKLVEANPDAAIVINEMGVVQFVNQAAVKLFGKKQEDFIGELLGFSVKEGEISEIEVFRDGETRNTEMHVVQLEWNKKPALLASIRDITEQKKLANRLRQAQKMAAIGQLAGGIAHDFNNILATILGNLKLARMDLSEDNPAQVSLSEMEKAASHAQGIIQQILTFSRNQETQRKTVRLESIIDESLRFLRATIPTQIEITQQIERDLPSVSADETQIHQILMNLGVNAAHAMPSGGQLKVSLTDVILQNDEANVSIGLNAGHYLRLSVSDTGKGMDKETCDRIFEPFFTTKAAGEGTGLGLSVVHGIMKSHEGAVTVYSEPGKGTMFNLYFPAVLTPNTTIPTTVQTASPKSGKTGHILYVDDEESLVFLAERMLERLGYEVSGFVYPKDAIEAFRRNPSEYDIVITDMAMPGIDGAELVRQIRQIRSDVPIVMTTGYIRPQDTDIAAELGVKDIVLKPSSVEKLAEIASQIMDEILQ